MSDHLPPLPDPPHDPEALIDLRDEAAPVNVRRRHMHGRPRGDAAMSDLQRYRDSHTRPAPAGPGASGRAGSPMEDLAGPARKVLPDTTSAPEVAPAPAIRRRGPVRRPLRPWAPAASPDDHAEAVEPAPDLTRDLVLPSPPEAVSSAPHDLLVVQKVRLWSVAKMATAVYLSGLAVVLVAGAVLWLLADREGWISKWTDFLVAIGFEGATVDGATMLRASAVIGMVLVATAAALTVAVAIVYNQFSYFLGGVEFVFRQRARRRRFWQRRKAPT